MFALLLGLINPLSRIAEQIARYKIAAQNAKTDQERIAAEERVKSLEARMAVISSQPPEARMVDAFIRVGFAAPFIIYNAKLVVWDKVFSLGATDGLSTELMQIEMIVVGFYFLHWVGRLWGK